MNYQRIYNKLILNRKNNPIDGYTEKHHIIPKSHGGDNNKDNLVRLSAREHFVAHWLLWRIHMDRSMALAFSSMCINKTGNRYKNSHGFQEARKARSIAMSGTNNYFYGRKGETSPHYGKILSEETRLKRSISLTGKVRTLETRQKLREANLGKKLTDEQRKKISEAGKGRVCSEETRLKLSIANKGKIVSEETKQKLRIANAGQIVTEETRNKIRISHTGKKQSKESIEKRRLKVIGKPHPQKKIECPHCNKIGGITNMKRYHFDNCKSNIK